jgi:2-C-methyl-D-erythritol 2,4-cyclodiphosphate synthase
MMRVGIGYDIHPTDPERPLVLGGVRIPADFGLSGHSDADVILHALMDALLGAAGLGDIGRHFPPGDERYRNVASLDLMRSVSELLRLEGYTVINADVVAVAERPRLLPFVEEMRNHISRALGVEPATVSIKATTNEGMGPEGRGEAISAHAVALLDRPT